MNRKTIWRLDSAKRRELEPAFEEYAARNEKRMPWLFELDEDDMGPPRILHDSNTGKPLYDEEHKLSWINREAWKELRAILVKYTGPGAIVVKDINDNYTVYNDALEYVSEKMIEYEDEGKPFTAELQVMEDGENRLVIHNIEDRCVDNRKPYEPLYKTVRVTIVETITFLSEDDIVKLAKPIIYEDKGNEGEA